MHFTPVVQFQGVTEPPSCTWSDVGTSNGVGIQQAQLLLPPIQGQSLAQAFQADVNRQRTPAPGATIETVSGIGDQATALLGELAGYTAILVIRTPTHLLDLITLIGGQGTAMPDHNTMLTDLVALGRRIQLRLPASS